MKYVLTLFLLTGITSLFGQSKLYLQNLDKPERIREVVLADIRLHTLDGSYFELTHPIISAGWIISDQDSIAMLEITDIRCATRAGKYGKAYYLLAAGGVIAFTAGGISFMNELFDSATSPNYDNQFPLAILGLSAGTAATVIGYKLAGFARRYQVRDARWQLIMDSK